MKNQSRKTDKLGRKQYSGSERRELVRKFEKSEGVTQADFSKANGLEHTTFSGWLRRLGRKKRKSFPVAQRGQTLVAPSEAWRAMSVSP